MAGDKLDEAVCAVLKKNYNQPPFKVTRVAAGKYLIGEDMQKPVMLRQTNDVWGAEDAELGLTLTFFFWFFCF